MKVNVQTMQGIILFAIVFMNSVRLNFFNTDLELPVLSDPKRAACFILAIYAKVPLFLRKHQSIYTV